MKVFFTIITKSYLAQARVLEACLSEFHPNIKFLVVLVDNPDGYFDPTKEKFEIIQLSEILDPDWWPKVTGYYTAYELCNAAKPFAHEYLLTNKGFDCTVYLDSDIYVLDSLDAALAELKNHSFVITPHLLKPDLFFCSEILEVTLIWSGIFNGGFVALRRCGESMEFLKWWKKRLIWNCTQENGPTEVDQSWLNYVPVFFNNCKIFRNIGFNVAHWNIHEREISLSNNKSVFAGSDRMVFFHLSGWDFNFPDNLTKHKSFSHLMNSDENLAWEFIWKRYFDLLQSECVQHCSEYPYSFALAKDGSIITPQMRKMYRLKLKEASSEITHLVPTIFESPDIYKIHEWITPQISVRKALLELKEACIASCKRRLGFTSLEKAKLNNV